MGVVRCVHRGHSARCVHYWIIKRDKGEMMSDIEQRLAAIKAECERRGWHLTYKEFIGEIFISTPRQGTHTYGVGELDALEFYLWPGDPDAPVVVIKQQTGGNEYVQWKICKCFQPEECPFAKKEHSHHGSGIWYVPAEGCPGPAPPGKKYVLVLVDEVSG